MHTVVGSLYKLTYQSVFGSCTSWMFGWKVTNKWLMVLLTLFQCLLSVLLVWKILLITGWVSNPVNSWVDYETLWVVLVCPIRQVQIIQYHLTKLYQKYNERLKCWSFYCIVSYAFSACLSLQSSWSSAWCMNSGVICILSITHDRT